MQARLDSSGSMTAEFQARVEARRREVDAAFDDLRSPRRVFVNLVGERYAGCTFENFEVTNDAQREAVRACREVAANVADAVESGRSIVLAGPVGTGKDHLMACMLREAVRSRICCDRVNGSDLAGQCRDLIGGHSTERDFLDRWASVPLLALSDPDGQKESAYYLDWLYRIVDGRYRDSRALWVTLNANDESSAERAVGTRAWDRMRHGALIIRTNWRTHRRVGAVVNREERK